MFAINGDFSHGAFYGDKINGMQTVIMQSAENADKVVSDFDKYFMAGLDPNMVIQKIMDINNFTNSDFTESDIHRINKKIESIYKSKTRKEQEGEI